MDGVNGRQKHGFYTARFVEAESLDDAERIAVEKLRASEKLRSLTLNDPGNRPIIHVEEVTELPSFDDAGSLEPGFIWYEEDPGNDDVDARQ
jgi:hypothetical protein